MFGGLVRQTRSPLELGVWGLEFGVRGMKGKYKERIQRDSIKGKYKGEV